MSEDPEYTPGTPEWIARREAERDASRPVQMSRIIGTGPGFGAPAMVGGAENIIYADALRKVPMRLTFTPEVDWWWVVAASVSFQGGSAGALATYLSLSPADVDGVAAAEVAPRCDSVGSASLIRGFALVAGTTYTVTLCAKPAGANWVWDNTPKRLWMDARGWAR